MLVSFRCNQHLNFPDVFRERLDAIAVTMDVYGLSVSG